MITEERVWLDVLRRVLERSHLWRPEDVAEAAAEAMDRVHIAATVYLVDLEQETLRPMPVRGRTTPPPEPVGGSAPGTAYSLVRSSAGKDPARWWVPMVNGTDRLGVVDFVLPAGVDPHTPELRQRCEMFAGLIGHMVTVTEPRGDRLQLMRRSAPMSAASELLWQMLQPMTVATEELALAAVLRPCYEVGGDGYDYAIDGSALQVAILDAAGSGLKAGLATAVALAAIRSTRRAGGDLYEQARAVDTELVAQFPDARFVTAFLARLDLSTGVLTCLNAGHPAPFRLRRGESAGPITGGARMPLGIEDPAVTVAEHRLAPGDRLLLWTDGVTEARDAEGTQFGPARLLELTGRHEGLPVPETLRRLSHSIVEHQHGPPADDATLVLVEWSRAAADRTVPG